MPAIMVPETVVLGRLDGKGVRGVVVAVGRAAGEHVLGSVICDGAGWGGARGCVGDGFGVFVLGACEEEAGGALGEGGLFHG